MVRVKVNGTEREAPAGAKVATLLESLGIDPLTVVVQRNDAVVTRDAFATTDVCAGDQIEIVRLVGGG